MNTTRYASHYLRLGIYRVRFPLIELKNGRLSGLSVFEKECANTLFINGEIVLQHTNYPIPKPLETHDITISELYMLLNGIDWASVEIHIPNT